MRIATQEAMSVMAVLVAVPLMTSRALRYSRRVDQLVSMVATPKR
jgi:hypothetical protein